jgi:hypothetical protein
VEKVLDARYISQTGEVELELEAYVKWKGDDYPTPEWVQDKSLDKNSYDDALKLLVTNTKNNNNNNNNKILLGGRGEVVDHQSPSDVASIKQAVVQVPIKKRCSSTTTISVPTLLNRFFNQLFINQALKYAKELMNQNNRNVNVGSDGMDQHQQHQLVIIDDDKLHSAIKQLSTSVNSVIKSIVNKFHEQQQCEQHEYDDDDDDDDDDEEETSGGGEGLSTKGRSAAAAAATNNNKKGGGSMLTTTITNTSTTTSTTSTTTITMAALLKRFYNQELINHALNHVQELNAMDQQLVINDELHSVIEQVYIACDDVTKEIVNKFHEHEQHEQHEQHEYHHEESKKGGKGEEEGLSTKGRSHVAAAATNNSNKSFMSSSPSPSSSPATMLTTGSESESGGGETSGMHIDVDPLLVFNNNNSIISPFSGGGGDDDDRCHGVSGDGGGNEDEDGVEVGGHNKHEGYDEIDDRDNDNDGNSGGYSTDEINHLNKYSKEV